MLIWNVLSCKPGLQPFWTWCVLELLILGEKVDTTESKSVKPETSAEAGFAANPFDFSAMTGLLNVTQNCITYLNISFEIIDLEFNTVHFLKIRPYFDAYVISTVHSAICPGEEAHVSVFLY